MHRNIDKDSYSELVDSISKINNTSMLEGFLKELLTPSERATLSMRWGLLTMLKDGHPQREIAAELGISLCKITRGAKILKEKESITKKILDQKENEKEKTKCKQKFY